MRPDRLPIKIGRLDMFRGLLLNAEDTRNDWLYRVENPSSELLLAGEIELRVGIP